MNPTATTLTDRSRIWACGISCLSDLFLGIAAEYNDRVELCVIIRDFEGVVRRIDTASTERPDVVVAGGSNGAYLRPRLSLPAVVVNPTDFDMIHALAHARRNAESVALVTHGDAPGGVCHFVAAYGMDVVFASYISHQGAESCMLDLRDRGVGMVVGPGLVTDLVIQAGMNAVFLYSRGSVRTVFDTALEVVQATCRETLRHQRLDNLLQYLRDGTVALDAQDRMETINQRLTTASGTEARQVIGQPLPSIIPNLLGLLPDTDGDTLGTIQSISCVVHRGSFTSTGTGAAEGTVFTLQESRAIERLDRTPCSRQYPQQSSARYRLEDLVDESLAMERVCTLIRYYAKSDATALVLGGSGTDKEMVAQGMHQLSAWRDFPFVVINCGAFPEVLLESELFGYEESAFTGACKGGKTGPVEVTHRGTLFLDGIDEMPLPLQSHLLCVLWERKVARLGFTEPTRVGIRVVAVTYRALADAVEAGTFRANLCYHLNILNIGLPPLRERPDDVMPLAAKLFVQAARRESRLLPRIADTKGAVRVLASTAESLRHYTWIGNMRELQSMVERIIAELAYTEDVSTVTQGVLRLIASEVFAHATPGKPATLTLRERSRGAETEEICTALVTHGGDRDAVYAVSGISKTTLWRQL